MINNFNNNKKNHFILFVFKNLSHIYNIYYKIRQQNGVYF